MSFFDQKQEVIDIELTPYGRSLLSKGKWKPVYYAFFDDDIIYDGRYTNIQETNAEAVERIKNIPRLKSHYTFTGIEEQVEKYLESIKQNKQFLESLQQPARADKHLYFNSRLGTSILGDKSLPALKIQVLNGEIQNTTIFQSVEKPNLKLPSIELKEINYTINSTKLQNNSEQLNPLTIPIVFPDNSAIEIVEDFLLLEINEENVEDQIKNFEIEMYAVELDSITNEESYIPIYFDQKFETYKNGILLDSPNLSKEEQDYLEQQKTLDSFRAENYFNISIDNEIDKNLICKLINKVSNGNTNGYMSDYECEDIKAVGQKINASTVYKSELTENEIKKC